MSVHDVVLPYESAQNEHVKDWHPSGRTRLHLLRDTSLLHKFVSPKVTLHNFIRIFVHILENIYTHLRGP